MSVVKTISVQDRVGSLSREILIALAGSCFLTLFSQWAIPLPFTPVPLTLQTFAVFVLGGVLGSRRAVYSVGAYLVQGCCGLPVFGGGAVKALWFLDPKAGFLLSFIAAAYIIGRGIEKRERPPFFYIVFMLTLGQLAISGIGMLWLALYVGFYKAFLFGVLPFLGTAALKITAGALSLYAVKRGL